MDKSSIPKVYFTKNLIPENLVVLYEKLNKPLPGKVGIKIHSGEHDKGYYIQPDFMKPLIDKLQATLIEANTITIPGWDQRRNTCDKHYKLIESHGFLKVAKMEILDETGEIALPSGENMLKENLVGKGIEHFDSICVLSHFKGHISAGFGGALKNVAIGMASPNGKWRIHKGIEGEELKTKPLNDNDPFTERMAEANKAVYKFMKGNMVYLNVMKDLSVDCDCAFDPKDPEMKDVGMLASVDPVALDQACVDLIYNSDDKGKEGIIKRIEEKNGVHILEHGEKIGMGSRKYELVDIDK